MTAEAPAPKPMTWQTMETAPKNLRIIACEYAAGVVQELGIVWWDRMNDGFYYAPQGGVVRNWKPTHWMPLPAGPQP